MKPKHKQIIIPPEDGWKERAVYHVEASFDPSNPIHGYLFYSGYLNGPKRTPGGYNEFYGTEGENINTVYYIRVLSLVIKEYRIERVPNLYKMVHELPHLQSL